MTVQTSRGERDDGSIDEDFRDRTMTMQAGRAVLGFTGARVSEKSWTSLILSWDNSGDTPYNA